MAGFISERVACILECLAGIIGIRSFRKLRRPMCAAVGHQRPGRARHFVGECHRHNLKGPPRQELREPEIFPRVLLGTPEHGDRPDDENPSQVAVALLGDRPSFCLPPVES
jgi:hypothetical protein